MYRTKHNFEDNKTSALRKNHHSKILVLKKGKEKRKSKKEKMKKKINLFSHQKSITSTLKI